MFEEKYPINYGEFEAAVADIKAGAEGSKFLGAGAESRVWQACVGSEKYAIKIAQENALNGRGRVKNRSWMTEVRIKSGLMALGIEGLEQFVSGSLEDYVAIFRFVEGKRLAELTRNSLPLITTEQKQKFNETVAKATEAGLVFDGANPSGANAFYNPDSGFTLIDYSEAGWPITYDENWSYAIRSLGPMALRAFAL